MSSSVSISFFDHGPTHYLALVAELSHNILRLSQIQRVVFRIGGQDYLAPECNLEPHLALQEMPFPQPQGQASPSSPLPHPKQEVVQG